MLFLRLIKNEIKQYLLALPLSLLGGLLFTSLIGILMYGIIMYSSQDSEHNKAIVAVVCDENGVEDDYINLGMTLLSSMESTSEFFEFKIMNEKKANKLLKNGEIIAVFTLPSGAVQDIMYGYNTDITITFNDADPLSQVLLSEITHSGATLLKGAQAGTYVTHDIYYKLGINDKLNEAYNDVDSFNFRAALRRELTFEYQDIYGNKYEPGESSLNMTVIFYIASAITIILLIPSFMFCGQIKCDNEQFLLYGSSRKAFQFLYVLSKVIVLTMFYFLFLVLISVSYNLVSGNITLIDLPACNLPIWTGLIISFLYSTIATFIYFTAPTIRDGLTGYFLISSVIAFISGIIIPLAFLPSAIKKISSFMPLKNIHILMMSALNNTETSQSLYPLCYCIVVSLVMIALSYLVLKIKISKPGSVN